jgi:CspA family cold shock protein
LLLIFRLLTETKSPPALNSLKIDEYCLDLLKVLWDEERALTCFKEAIIVLDKALKKTIYSKDDAARRKIFTENIEKLSKEHKGDPNEASAATVDRTNGIVNWFSEIKGYGFIQCQNSDDVFVHYSNIRGTGYKNLSDGDKVSFIMVETKKGLQAEDVLVVK